MEGKYLIILTVLYRINKATLKIRNTSVSTVCSSLMFALHKRNITKLPFLGTHLYRNAKVLDRKKEIKKLLRLFAVYHFLFSRLAFYIAHDKLATMTAFFLNHPENISCGYS